MKEQWVLGSTMVSETIQKGITPAYLHKYSCVARNGAMLIYAFSLHYVLGTRLQLDRLYYLLPVAGKVVTGISNAHKAYAGLELQKFCDFSTQGIG